MTYIGVIRVDGKAPKKKKKKELHAGIFHQRQAAVSSNVSSVIAPIWKVCL